jgi:hypothetical protein
MMQAKLAFIGEDAETLELAIKPDNLAEMIMKSKGENLSFELSVHKIGTLLATLDDLLMNLKIAEDILSIGEMR